MLVKNADFINNMIEAQDRFYNVPKEKKLTCPLAYLQNC